MTKKEQISRLVEMREKINRNFSDEIKKKIALAIDTNKVSVKEVQREYGVASTTVYRWLYKYSSFRQKGTKIIVDEKSVSNRVIELNKRIKELEQIIGQKQILIDVQSRMIDLAEKEYNIDIKKNSSSKQSLKSAKKRKT